MTRPHILRPQNDNHNNNEQFVEQQEQQPLLDSTQISNSSEGSNTINRRKMNYLDGPDGQAELNDIVLNSERKRQRESIPSMYKHFTNISHVCALTISVYIIVLCFKTEFEFFTWHPFLFAIGWMSLMTEGVLILSKNNFLADRISHTWRVRCHWILQAIAMICIVVGFTIVVVNKNLKNKQHWKSWHGLLGLISFICAVIPTCITGIPALFHRELRDYISSKLNQLIHSIFGIGTLIIGSVTMILSLYTNWFAKKTGRDETIFVVCWIVMVIPLFWVLFAPLRKAFQRSKTLIVQK